MTRGCLGPIAVAFVAVASIVALQASDDLIGAALRDDAAGVEVLLKSGASVNTARGDGLTALHAAAMAGDAALAARLIDAGADIDARTKLLGTTPLDLAAKNGQSAAARLLIERGADPGLADGLGTTPLMFGAGAGDPDVVSALLDAGADPNVTESARGETALMFAAANGRTEAVRILLARGADWRTATKVFDWTKLPKTDPRLASGDAHPIKKGPNGEDLAQDEDGQAPKTHAGKPEGPRPPTYIELVGTQGGLTALMFAARQGHLETVRAFVECGADVNEIDPGDSTTALMIAIVNGRFDVAMYLVEHGADPNLAQRNGAAPLYAVLDARWAPRSEYPNPLYYANQHVDYLQLLRALLDRGADPNTRLIRKVWYTNQNNDQSGLDETGATPFWRAAYASDVEAMKLLVSHGADPNIPTSYPGKASEYPPPDPAVSADLSGVPAVAVGGPNISPLLAASGEGYGWSFTANHHRYAPTGMLAAVKYLVDVLHADVNARDAAGNTALHNAAARGDNEMIRYLVSKGADPKALNRKGQTVADMANGPMQRVQPFPETLALLSTMGVKPRHACVSC